MNATAESETPNKARAPLAWDGLLSPRLGAMRSKVEAEHSAHVSLAQSVNSFALSQMIGRSIEMKRDADYLAPPLFGRTILDFEAIVLLAGNGFCAQARSMARSTFETACHVGAACRDLQLSQGARGNGPKSLLAAIEGGHERFRRSVATAIKGMAETPADIASRLHALGSTLDRAIEFLPKINVEGLAADLGVSDLYALLYRPLSQDAHPTATSMQHHVAIDSSGDIVGFKVVPDFAQYEDTFLSGVASLLLASTEYADRFGDQSDRDKVKALTAEYRAVSEADGERRMRVIVKKPFIVVRPGKVQTVLPESSELSVGREGPFYRIGFPNGGALDLTEDEFNRHLVAGDLERAA